MAGLAGFAVASAVGGVSVNFAMLGLLIAAGGMVWLTTIGVHSGYAPAILGPLLVTGLGIGQVAAPAVNTGT
jgi:hypothetical protein